MNPLRPRSLSEGSNSYDGHVSRLKLELLVLQPAAAPAVPLKGSETARMRLIAALRDEKPERSCRELAGDVPKFSTVELAAYLAAMLQLPYNADVAEPLAHAVLRLASCFAEMSHAPKTYLADFADLLMHRPTCAELADFLEKKEDEMQEVDEEFITITWSHLAKGLHMFSSLTHLEEGVKELFARWLCFERHELTTVVAIIFSWYLLNDTVPHDVNIAQLSQDNNVQEFVLYALSRAVFNGDMGYTLLRKFAKFYSGENELDWSLIVNLSAQSLKYLECILKETKGEVYDEAICLKLLENPCHDELVKVCIITNVLRSRQDMNLCFLYPFISALAHLHRQADCPEHHWTFAIVRLLFEREWTSSLITLTYEPHDYAAEYIQDVCLFLNNFNHFLMAIFEDEQGFRERLDIVLERTCVAIVEDFALFAQQNILALQNISPRAVPERLSIATRIKVATLRLLFYLYDKFDNVAKKREVFDTFAEVLPQIQISKLESEFVVHKEYVEHSTFLVFRISEKANPFYIKAP
jgi:hypothetical protein